MKGFLRLLVSGAAFGLDLLRDTLDPPVIKRGNGQSPIHRWVSRVFSRVFFYRWVSHSKLHGYFPATFGTKKSRQESFILQDPDDEEVVEALAEEPFVDDYLDCPAVPRAPVRS